MANEERKRAPVTIAIALLSCLLGIGVANLPYLSDRQGEDKQVEAAAYQQFDRVLTQLESAISLGTSIRDYDALVKSLDFEFRSLGAGAQNGAVYPIAEQIVKMHTGALRLWGSNQHGKSFNQYWGGNIETIRSSYPYVPLSKFVPYKGSDKSFLKKVCLAGSKCLEGSYVWYKNDLLTPKELLNVIWQNSLEEVIRFRTQLRS